MVQGYVDCVVLALMPEVESGLAAAVGGPLADGYPTEKYVEKMDESGVEISILLASKGGGHDLARGGRFEAWEVPAAGIKEVIDAQPDRFRGLIGVDPTDPDTNLREIEKWIGTEGFVGVHLYPHWWLKPPDDRIYYPAYELCAALDVPIQIQVGSSLVPFLPSVGRPLSLEQVAIDFPTLRIIGSHTGWPWVEEMVAVMQNHPNVYTATSCHYPSLDWRNPVTGLRPLPKWGESLLAFCNEGSVLDGTPGSHRVLFGTDFPEWEYSIAVDEARDVLRAEAFERVMRDNAVEVFDLGDVGG